VTPKKGYDRLTFAGFKPCLNIMDNEASTAVKRQIVTSGATYQLVEPHNHCVNAAERAIRTWKNHFIACLCSTDPSFPVRLWDKLIPQAELTLNVLHTSRINPKLSAHAKIHGIFDFNRTPLARPGTRVLLHETPDNRTSWSPHGKEAWYVGPALEHYRCYQSYVPDTNGLRITSTAKFFPAYTKMPTLSSANLATNAAERLIHALQHSSFPAPYKSLAP
jgi:hypothetical protein